MLTNRERDLLDFLIQFKKVNGFSPSIDEIMIGINTKSKHHIYLMLEKLESNKYISHRKNMPRTIVVLKFNY